MFCRFAENEGVQFSLFGFIGAGLHFRTQPGNMSSKRGKRLQGLATGFTGGKWCFKIQPFGVHIRFWPGKKWLGRTRLSRKAQKLYLENWSSAEGFCKLIFKHLVLFSRVARIGKRQMISWKYEKESWSGFVRWKMFLAFHWSADRTMIVSTWNLLYVYKYNWELWSYV